MRKIFLFLFSVSFILFSASVCSAQSGIISTIVGSGGSGSFTGDNGPATAATLNVPQGIAFDASGNLFFSDWANYRIRKVDVAGIITTIAGTGTPGYTGDGGPATIATLGRPTGLAMDNVGNLFIADQDNHAVRKIDLSGNISTVAGTGTPGYTGDTGPATVAQLNHPYYIAFDLSGNLIIADESNHAIRKVDGSGTITTIAGNGTPGYSGDGGAATDAQLNSPAGVCTDNLGNIFIADPGSHIVRKIDNTGTISTYAGTGSTAYGVDGVPATTANINVVNVFSDPVGNLFIADQTNNRAFIVHPSGIISTFAGTGVAGYMGDGGPATAATINGIWLLTMDHSGNYYVTDQNNNVIRKIIGRPSVITGTMNVCVGSTTTLSDSVAGGIWSSGNTAIGTVNSSTGVVTGISTGTTLISYTLSGDTVVTSVLVNPLPIAGTITGTVTVCPAATTTLTDAAIGGTWSSVTGGVATIGSTGIVMGVGAGTSVISYTVSNSCGTAAATTTVTVNPAPDAGTIIGASDICPLSSTTLTSTGDAGGTWSATNTNATVVGSVVTGVSLGVDTIMYAVPNSCGTATATFTVTVSTTPFAGTIFGPSSICAGFSTSVSETVGGGAWSATNGDVTIGSTGIVFASTAGVDTILYTVTASCGSAMDSFVITVNPLPNAGSISSTSSEICISGTALFTDGATGGSWSSATPAYATISGGGLLTGRGAGVAVISYTVSNGCGIAAATATILVDGAPDAGFISGVPGICISGVAVFSDGAAGGSWSSTVPTVATVDAYGDVSPASVGSTTISYTVTNTCGSIAATYPVTIVGYPTGGTILGTPTVCVTSAVTLSDAAAGGVWSISGGTATIGSSSGIVTGAAPGLALVTYTVTNLCGTATAPYSVYVDPLPHAGVVTGLDSVCRGSLLALADTTAGGAWSTAGSGIATVSSSGTVVGLATGTETIIYTTTNMCGTATATKRILVNDVPVVPGITGATSVCAGAHTTLTDATTGGTWHSTGSAATAAGGVITGVTADTVTITYTVTNSCGTTAVATIVTVNIAPASNPILGPSTYCIDELSHLYDSTSGGIWSISNGNAYLDATGSIAALTPGQDTVTYVATNACGTASETFVVTIYPDSICYPVSVQTTTSNETALSVFPNPNNGSFSMQLTSPTSGSVHFVITNILGEKIKKTDSDTNTPAAVTLNVAGGIYFVSAITADGSRYMQKVIVR